MLSPISFSTRTAFQFPSPVSIFGPSGLGLSGFGGAPRLMSPGASATTISTQAQSSASNCHPNPLQNSMMALSQMALSQLLSSLLPSSQQTVQSPSALNGLNSVLTNLNSQLTTPGTTPPPVTAPGSTPTQTKPQQTAPAGNLVIAQIDNFTADDTGFNHGAEIAKTLRAGGSDTSLNGKVDLIQYDISKGDLRQNIANSVEDVLRRVQNGEKIDAVNISLYDLQDNATSARVDAAVEKLKALGVPVAIAAGNFGPNVVNQLTSPNAFNVMSSTNGKINASSGIGNVIARGDSTSFATANLAPVLARRRQLGFTVDQIMQEIRNTNGFIRLQPPT